MNGSSIYHIFSTIASKCPSFSSQMSSSSSSPQPTPTSRPNCKNCQHCPTTSCSIATIRPSERSTPPRNGEEKCGSLLETRFSPSRSCCRGKRSLSSTWNVRCSNWPSQGSSSCAPPRSSSVMPFPTWKDIYVEPRKISLLSSRTKGPKSRSCNSRRGQPPTIWASSSALKYR